MDKKRLKTIGIICLVVCVICLFVAVERYQANVAAVNAMKSMMGSAPFEGMVGEIKPTIPVVTKYALFFAAISGIGGLVLLAKSTSTE